MNQTHGTRQYEISHGKKPRGRGNWAIEVTAWRGLGSTTETIFPGPGLTLTEAREAAVSKMKSEISGLTRIHTEVLP